MIRIEPTIPADLPVIIALENEPENTAFILPYALTRHQAVIENEDEAHLKIIDSNNTIVGFVILAGLVNPHQSLEFRRIVVGEKGKGKGYGKTTLAWVKAYCFDQLKCHRLWLDVFEDNVRARKLYQSAGFIEEGILRECIKTGSGYRSLVIMSVLETEIKQPVRSTQ